MFSLIFLKYTIKLRWYVYQIGFHWDKIKESPDSYSQDLQKTLSALDNFITSFSREYSIWCMVYSNAYFEIPSTLFSKLKNFFEIQRASFFLYLYSKRNTRIGKLHRAFTLCRQRVEQANYLLKRREPDD
ncbi:MAG: hypothetical protein ACLTEH_00980 [Clostridia bacterium]|jgi:hypothetical protein